MEDDRIITFDDMPGWDSDIELSSNSNIAGSSSSSKPTSSSSNVSVSSNSTTPTSSASNSANSNNNSANSNTNSDNSNGNSTTPGSNSSNTEAIGANTLPAGATLTFQGSSNLSFTTIRATSVSLDVFDLQGNRVANLYKGALSAGTHQFSLSGMARGSYLVRAKGAGLSATKRIVIK